MSIQTSTGVKIYISTQLPATFDLAGYGALTWTEIKEVTNIVPPSPSYQVVTHEPLKTGITQKNKGFVDYGDPTIDYALDTSDTGQQMLQSAASGATKNLEHSFKLTYPNGDIRYFSGRVFSSLEGGFSANSMVSGTSNVGVSRAVVKIPAISFAANYITNTYSILGESKTFADAHTFTRSTTATFVGSNGLIQSAAIDAPRFTYDPVTLAPKGLLIEGSRTNLLTYSEQFDNAAWAKNGDTVTANNASINAPDGTTNSDLFVESADSTSHWISKSVVFASGSSYTLSVFWRPSNNGRYLRLNFNSGAFGVSSNANFDTVNSSVTYSNNCTTQVVQLANGWYRCSITAVSTTTVTDNMYIGLTDSPTGTFTYTGNGSSAIRIWGAQLEAGSFASSYIPTTTAQVTRTADVCTAKEFTSWYNQGEGSVFVDGQTNSTGLIPLNLFNIRSVASGNYSIRVRWVNGQAGYSMVSTENSVDIGNAELSSGFLNDFSISSSYSQSGVKISDNTGLVTQSGSAYKQMGLMVIGSSQTASHLFGTIAELNYYPTALSDEALQDLTR